MPTASGFAMLLALMGGERRSQADDTSSEQRSSSFAIGNQTYFLGGGNLGLVVDDGDVGTLWGAEASVVHLWNDDWWAGGFVDALADSHRDGFRVAIGGEGGVSAIGIDVAPVFEYSNGPKLDFRVRAALTSGVVSICFGPVFPVTARDERDKWLELSVLLKPFVN
jgi:hypothetical protein